MCDSLRRFAIAVLVLTLLPFASTPAIAGEPSETRVNGTLSEIDGVRILRVWGTPKERGFAHGYLLAETIAPMADGYLRDGPLGRSVEHYEQQTLPKLRLMKIDPEYEAELRGLLAGIEERFAAPMNVPFLGRPLQYEDIVAINCTGDLARSGCSSFAAWGNLTPHGHTIGARNMDWPVVPALLDTLIIFVNVPAPESGKLGWVSITWPSYVGCLTGMNSEGVTVATHDAGGRAPSISGEFTPYGFIFREALESARASTAVDDIAQAIREGVSIVGNNMMVTRPYTGNGPGAVVFEFDGDLSLGGGLTIRDPEQANSFLVCTNHFRKRAEPISCDRHGGLTRTLQSIARSGGKRHLDLKRAWKMIGGVSFESIMTYHSVVFEPNKRLTHVAFTENGRNAPQCKHVTLDVTKLLAGDYPGGTRP